MAPEVEGAAKRSGRGSGEGGGSRVGSVALVENILPVTQNLKDKVCVTNIKAKLCSQMFSATGKPSTKKKVWR